MLYPPFVKSGFYSQIIRGFCRPGIQTYRLMVLFQCRGTGSFQLVFFFFFSFIVRLALVDFPFWKLQNGLPI